MANAALRTAGDYALAKALFGLTRAVGTLPIDRALDLAHAIGVRLGPRSSRHRIVMANLALAFPERSQGQRERIGREMWGHQARLIVEAGFPERLFDFPGGGRIEVTGRDGLEAHVAEGERAGLFLTGHTGCFEFLPAVARALGYPLAVLFRPPNNRFIASRLLEKREGMNGTLVPSRGGAMKRLEEELAEKRGVGVLVDQKFTGGAMVPFFGVPAPTNGLIVRLARRTDGVVLPARCVRLPENRYRIEIEPPMSLPREADGTIALERALSAVNAKVEAWVREYPEQWMWFHRRWG